MIKRGLLLLAAIILMAFVAFTLLDVFFRFLAATFYIGVVLAAAIGACVLCIYLFVKSKDKL